MLRIGALLAVLVLAGCDAGAPSAVAEPVAAHTPKSAPQPVGPPAVEPPEPPPVATPQAAGECATSETCSAAAADEERKGHPDRAAPLYARACDLGLGQACHRLGELYRDGKGVAPDDDRAHALFEQGCRQASNAACDALGH